MSGMPAIATAVATTVATVVTTCITGLDPPPPNSHQNNGKYVFVCSLIPFRKAGGALHKHMGTILAVIRSRLCWI